MQIQTEQRENLQIRRVTWIGLLVNIILTAGKLVAGVVGQSQAVVADGIHSLSDGVTDVAVIVGSYFWGKPPDDCHPYGHKRLETVVTIFIGFVLFAAGIGIGWNAIVTLHENPPCPPGWIAAAAAAASIVCKEGLYRWTVYAGRRIGSLSLKANAWHHRIDALSSIPALLAVGGAILFPEWNFLDRVGAIVVSLFIFQAALKIVLQGVQELMDAGAPRKIAEEIKDIACQHSEVYQVHGVRTRYTGNKLHVDLHVVVDGSLTVSQGHDIAEAVQQSILQKGPGVMDVVVHIEPLEYAKPEA